VRLLPIATTLALLAAAPAANAAWTAPQRFAGPGASSVFAAANRHGSEVLVWRVDSKRLVHVGSQTGLASEIRARVRLPDGTLGRPVTLSTPGTIAGTPQVGVDERGNATAVWTQAGRFERVMAAFHPHGKPFGKAVEIGRSQAFLTARPAIAVGRFGDAVIAWNDGRRIAVRRYPGNAQCSAARHFACYRAAVRLRTGEDHVVAIGPLGSAYVAWAAIVRSGGDVKTRLRIVVIRRSGGRSAEHAVSRAADGNVSQPAISVRPDGVADLAWRSSLPTTGAENERAPILVAASGPDAVVTPPQPVSAAPSESPSIRVTRRGEAIVSWNQFASTPSNPDGEEVAYAVRPGAAPAFGPATRLSGPGEMAAGQSLAVNAAGEAAIVYAGAPAIGPAPAAEAGRTFVRPAGGVFAPAAAFPGQPTGAVRAFDAGPKVSAFGAAAGGWLVSDWTP
jgi:hypothetical protein